MFYKKWININYNRKKIIIYIYKNQKVKKEKKNVEILFFFK